MRGWNRALDRYVYVGLPCRVKSGTTPFSRPRFTAPVTFT